MQEHPKYGQLICKPNLQGTKEARKSKITIILTTFIIFSLMFLFPGSMGSPPFCFVFTFIFVCCVLLGGIFLRTQADSINLEFYEHGFIDHYASGFRKHEGSVDGYYLNGWNIYGQKEREERFRIIGLNSLTPTTIKKVLEDLELDETITWRNETMPTETAGCEPRKEYEIQDPTSNDFLVNALILAAIFYSLGALSLMSGNSVQPKFFLVCGFPLFLSILLKIFVRNPPDRIHFFNDLLVYIPRYRVKEHPDCLNYSIVLSDIEKLEYWDHWYRKRIIMWNNHDRVLGTFTISVPFPSKPKGLIKRIFKDISAELPKDTVIIMK